MQGYFWTNTIWFLLLFAVTIAMVTVALVKSDNRKFLIAFYLAMVGLYYVFEYFLVVVMGAYEYHPKIFPDDPFLDTYMGNVFSQTSIAGMCSLVISLKLKAKWYFIFAAGYFLLELLFINLGIFVTHWYKAIYTPIILVPLIWVMKKWYFTAAITWRKIDDRLLLFLGVVALGANAVSFPMRLLEIEVFTGKFFADPSRDHTATAMIYGVFYISMLISAYRVKGRWIWKGLLFAGLFLIEYASHKAGLMRNREGWFVWITLIQMAVYYFFICVLGNLLKKRLPENENPLLRNVAFLVDLILAELIIVSENIAPLIAFHFLYDALAQSIYSHRSHRALCRQM